MFTLSILHMHHILPYIGVYYSLLTTHYISLIRQRLRIVAAKLPPEVLLEVSNKHLILQSSERNVENPFAVLIELRLSINCIVHEVPYS